MASRVSPINPWETFNFTSFPSQQTAVGHRINIHSVERGLLFIPDVGELPQSTNECSG